MMTFLGVQDDCDTSAAVPSPAGKSYESEESSSDGAVQQLCVLTLAHL